MSKKISVGVALTLIIVSVLLTCVITISVMTVKQNYAMEDLPAKEQMYSLLSETDSIVRENYAGDVDSEKVKAASADGYLKGLTVGTNYFMDSEAYSEYKQRIQGIDPDTGETIKTVSSKTIGSVGYIRISAFYHSSVDEFSNAVKTFKSDTVTGIIIDVRGVQSFNLDDAAEIIDILVPVADEGTQSIATIVSKNGDTVKTFSSDSDTVNFKIAVITDENTAGAGELLAQDVKDFGKGVSVGEKTKGSGTYQQVFELSDDNAIVLTTGYVKPYTSESYDGKGVEPDYKVKTEPVKNDNDINKDAAFLQSYAYINM